ncbi:phage major capsid protein [Streptomyces sp. NPDC002088]|uniref:phage major capsid family protein n=1 Tax=Streptomyces sp. NPDC002088 TaxID=3154665 RepID=UPI0033169A50
MASTDIIDNWIPIEWDSDVITRVQMDSAVERYARPHIMSSATKRILRSGGLTVSAGTTYTADTSANDYITLQARRFLAQFVVDEDDLSDADSVIDTIQTKGMDWAVSYADTFDNACLAVTGTENGTTVPFTSLYKALRTTNSATGYTADANYAQWTSTNVSFPASGGGNSLYEKLSSTFKKVEAGKFWSLADSLVIAAPGWRDALRLATDGQGRPIFIQGTAGTPDTLFDVPIAWSRGCKTSPTNSGSPGGNDLLFFGNRQYLKRGDRTQPQSLVDQARAQDSTDDTAVKFRVRKAFGVGNENAWAGLERV